VRDETWILYHGVSPAVLLLSHLESRSAEALYASSRIISALMQPCGFYAGQKNETKVEVPDFVDKADRVVALRREHEAMRLMALVEQELCLEQARKHGRRPTAPCR
jgi:hypothetical protein